jgi:hypothetical protein
MRISSLPKALRCVRDVLSGSNGGQLIFIRVHPVKNVCFTGIALVHNKSVLERKNGRFAINARRMFEDQTLGVNY